jgi:CBS domain-containing protein
MGELVVADIMNRRPVAVRREAVFKDVVSALLAADAPAIAVVDADNTPIGTVEGRALLANLEFHGGNDPRPLLGGAEARGRWRRSRATTAAELMSGPPAIAYADLRVGPAVGQLAHSKQPLLCVVDAGMRLIGVLDSLDLLTVYQRSDSSIEADIHRLLVDDLERATRPPATITVQVDHGVVILDGTLLFRSRTEHAAYTVAHIPGVVAVHNNLSYEHDDLAITGF